MNNKYEIILDVYKTCNFSVTAEKFSYTASAVSQIVKNYENQLGVQLFYRKHNGIEPTPNAKYIVDELQKICGIENKIDQIALSLNNLTSGFIRIGTIQSISYHWLPEILKDFSEQYPKIKFEIVIGGFQELEDKILSNSIDLMFTSEYAVKDLDFTSLGTDELLLVLPRGHRLSSKKYVRLTDIRDEDYISTSDKLDYEAGEIFRAYKIQPNVTYELNDDYAAIKMVEAGFGITILPKLLLKDIPFDVCIRHFDEHFNRTLGVAYKKQGDLSPAARVFMMYTQRWHSEHHAEE